MRSVSLRYIHKAHARAEEHERRGKKLESVVDKYAYHLQEVRCQANVSTEAREAGGPPPLILALDHIVF